MATLDDRYELSKVLGRGSSGTVWEAIDRSTSRTVAVKILEPRVLAARHARKRFLREVGTARALCHPHVVEIYGHAETPDGGAYLVMEHLAGQTLAAKLRETGPLPQPLAMRIIGQTLDAVLAAHRLGVVHRDLKPSNVMLVERDGDPHFIKVCDFGLAKDIERDSADPSCGAELALAVELASITTEHGHICGTPEYMAPEQARGEPVDERADLYAIAVMLYQAVVGRPPFSARSPLAVVSLHLTAAPPRPSELRPDLAIFPPLESLILRGLAKDRAERPSSADVFAADLARIERDFACWSRKQRAGSSSSSFPLESATLSLAPKASASTGRVRQLLTLAASLGGLALVLAGLMRGAGTSAAAPRSPSPSGPERAPVTPHSLAPSSAEIPVTALIPTAPPITASAAALAPSRAAPVARVRPPSVASGSLLATANEALLAGRIQEACSLAEKAAASPGASPRVWKFLGQCFMRLGARAKGVAYYQRYLELAPSGPDAVFVREMIK